MIHRKCNSILPVVALMAGALFVPAGSMANVKVVSSKTYCNRTGATKTDVHVKSWQKEDNIEIVSSTCTITATGGATVGPLTCNPGDQPEPAHSQVQNLGRPRTTNADNGTHAVDCEATTGTSVAPGQCVKLRCEFILTKWNTIHWADPVWTPFSGEATAAVTAGPNDGFEITDPIPDGGGNYRHRLTIFNDDNNGTSESFKLAGLKFGSLSSFFDIDTVSELEAYSGFGSPLADVTLAPGQSFSTDVITTGPLLAGGVAVSYSIVDPNTLEVLGDSLIGHEVDDETPTGACCTDGVDGCVNVTSATCQALAGKNFTYRGDGTQCGPNNTCIPTVSEWGLVAMALLVLTAATVVIMRRRAAVA